MTLESDEKKFIACCTKCKGKCCYGETGKEIIPLSKKESDYISENYPDVELWDSPEGMDFFYVPKKGCPFLTEKGCKIPEKHKPLNCRSYPLVFTIKDNKVEFYLDYSSLCPYIEELSKLNYWTREMVKTVEKEVKEWNEHEKKFFTEITEITENTNKKIKKD